MIREKMFRLHRHKQSTKSAGERIDFNFSNIQALQVPKGWDRLYVSFLSTETGKTVNKSGKAYVRNGTCQWTETLSESIYISQDEAPKEFQQYLFKLVVAMGSARSSVLGEVTINLAGYMSSRASIPLSLPLKKCNHGTVLQVEIQCLTPRIKHRDEKLNQTNSDGNSDYDDVENKSEVSDGTFTFTKSVGSSSSNHLDGTSHPGDLGSRETSFSASGSRYSFDSIEGSLGRESFSPQSNISGVVKHVIGRQDSGSGRHQHQREDSGQISHGTTASPLRNAGSSGNFLEAEVITMEELRVEARMWERNARKLMLDHELLMKEFADQSKQLANLDMELSASRTECDGFRQEIEYLKVLLDKSMDKQKAIENLKFQPKDMDNIQKVLEDEIKFQKESTHDLALQLKKTQDSNLELVSILQEMEETIEKQKEEIEKLATLKSKFDDTGKRCSFGHDDNGEVNANGEVSAKKMKKASCDSDLEGSTVEYPINDLHAGFEQEDNLNLEFQLEQLRESQKNLESTIVYLEKTLEDKNHEIVIEQDLKTRALQDCKAEWRCKLAAKEEETIDLEAKLSKALSDKNSEVLKFDNRGDPNLIKEIESLKEKVQELERDCNELTAENLELLLKLKEATKNLPTNGASCKSSPNKCTVDNPPVASEVEVSNFKYQMCQFEEEIKNDEIPIQGVADSNLPFKCVNVRNECTEMELQLQVFKGRGETTASKYHHPADVHTKCENSESRDAIDKFELLPALFEQLQLFVASVNKIQHTLNSHVDSKYTPAAKNLRSSTCTELTSRKDLEEAVLDNLVQLNKLFEAKISLCEDDFPCGETAIRSRNATEDQNKLESDNLKENTLCAFCQVINGSIKELESTVADLSKELLAKTSLIEKLNADSVLKEEEIKASIRRQRDLETQISDLQKIKEQMEENMEIMQSECSITSKCLDSLKNDLTVQSSSMESHLSNKKVLERKSLELERTKCELELHLSELEEENVHLSGRISGLEAQLRYLTDAREASRLELQQSESHVMNLQDDIQRLEDEMEAHKVTMKQKTEDMQKRWLEVQEECEYLRKANPKLQETAENLIEECSLLQKSNRELRQQKIELQEYGTVLEVELKETRNKFSNCTESIDALEAKFSGILEETSSKERFLNSELDALRQHNKEWEKLVHAEGLFNQVNFEKAAEVENLQQEVADLTGQNRSEASLQDFQGNFKLPQNKLENIQMDCETNILALMTELAASKENHQILVGNHKKLLGLLEDVRSNEEKHKGTIDKLESKLKSSEYERLQLAEEISCLKIQLQKIQPLQEEVLALKGSLYGTRFENERLQNSLDLLSGDCEELKTERISLLQKISSMQNAMLDSENCKRSKVALEEKILRMEGDLTASDALCSQDAELKNELGRIRRVSSQFQWKIKCLEEEKEEWLQRARALEEEVKQKKEVKQEQVVSSSSLVLVDPGSIGTNESTDQEWTHSEKYEEADIVLINQDLSEQCTETGQLQHFSEGRGIVQHQRQDNDEQQHDNPATSPKLEDDTVSRIKVLENELAEALEANDMYKAQLKSLLSEGQICHSKSHKKLEVENPAIDKEENKQKADFLEAELRDIQERYLEMSLKYAEVEAQREQLVMKLKTVNSGKRWFS